MAVWLTLVQATESSLPPARKCVIPIWSWCIRRGVCVQEVNINEHVDDISMITFADFVSSCCQRESVKKVKMRGWMHPFGSLLAVLGSSCTSIQFIELSDCDHIDGLEFLLHRSRHTVRELTVQNVSNARPGSFRGLELTALTELNICQVDESEIIISLVDLIAGCRRLKNIAFVESSVTSACISALTSTGKHLREAILDACALLTDDDLVLFSRQCPLLERFLWTTRSADSRVEDAGIVAIVANCTRLLTLQVGVTITTEPRFTDDLLCSIVHHCGARLLNLGLYGIRCANSSSGTLALAARCTNLRALEWNVRGVPMEAECTLFASLPLLQELRAGELRDAPLKAAVDTCTRLWYLEVGYTNSPLTVPGLEYALERCKGLKEPMLRGDQYLKCAKLPHWKAKRPEMQVSFSCEESCPSLRY